MKNFGYTGGITRFWWLPLITGLIGIGLGIWTLCVPSEALPILAYAFAIGLLIAGFFDIIFGILTTRHNSQWGWSIAMGILDFIAGGWMLSLPSNEVTLTFMYIVGIWILVVAINSICETFALSVYSPGWLIWILLLLIATVFLAVVFLFNPVATSIFSWIWIAIALITFGTYRVTVAFHIKKFRDRTRGMI